MNIFNHIRPESTNEVFLDAERMIAINTRHMSTA